MAFVDLAQNEMVTHANAATSLFELKPGQSPVYDNQCMTKAMMNAKYFLNQARLYNYADNQLVPKSNWGVPENRFIFYYNSESVDPSITCSIFPDESDEYSLYSDSQSLENGSVLFTDPELTNVFNGGNNYIKRKDDIYVYRISIIGWVTDIVSCEEVANAWSPFASNGYSTNGISCNSSIASQVLYTANAVFELTIGVQLFTNSSLTNGFNGQSKWYRFDGYSYLITNTGHIADKVQCGSLFTWLFSNSTSSIASACALSSATQTFYSRDKYLVIDSTILYTNFAATSPVTGGNNWYNLTNDGVVYQINNSGLIIGYDEC